MDVSKRKSTLKARLAALQGRIEGIEAELEAPHAQDWDDQAAEREGDEVLEGMGISGQAEIRRISAALARIEAGTYGTCAQCGQQISEERLDAVPEAPLCRDCAGAGP